MRGLRRFLITDGVMGEAPLWYRTIRAARYLGVPPWDLLNASAFWLHAAEEAEAAEAESDRQHAKRAARKKAV